MSNNIGELFKILGKNEIFTNYVKEVENNKTTSEIIDMAINNEELMNVLLTYVSDINVIKNKMDVIIGQKRKSYEKILEKKSINKEIIDKENIDEKEIEKEIIFKYKPINPENVICLTKYFYMEKVDHLMRLVNADFEFYY